jgi:hypothetical protein
VRAAAARCLADAGGEVVVAARPGRRGRGPDRILASPGAAYLTGGLFTVDGRAWPGL